MTDTVRVVGPAVHRRIVALGVKIEAARLNLTRSDLTLDQKLVFKRAIATYERVRQELIDGGKRT